jgi:hypothetical protein
MRNIDLPHALPHKRFHANLLKNGVGDQKCQQNQNRGQECLILKYGNQNHKSCKIEKPELQLSLDKKRRK